MAVIREGRYQCRGPITLRDLRNVVHAAAAKNYPDDARIEIRTPLNGDRRAVTLTVLEEDSAAEPGSARTQQGRQQ